MATKTLSNVGEPQAVHAGENVRVCRISLSVSNSVGDIHIIGRIPHGAIPTDAIFIAGAAFTNSSLGAVMKLGTSASADLFFNSDTYSSDAAGTVKRTTRPLGSAQQISLSDDFMPRYENLVFVAGAGVSIGHVGDLIVRYVMPGQSL